MPVNPSTPLNSGIRMSAMSPLRDPGPNACEGAPVVTATTAFLPARRPRSNTAVRPYTGPDTKTLSIQPLRIAGMPNHHKGNISSSRSASSR